MDIQDTETSSYQPDSATLQWLLDADPAIRWQVMRDFTDEPEEVVAAERARVATEGWGAELLSRQRPDGTWVHQDPERAWEATLYSLTLLRHFGIDPDSSQARVAIERLIEHFSWGPYFDDTRFFEGEVEPCINGGVLALGGYFGHTDDKLVDRLLGEQLEDGGWNCEAERGSTRSSFHTTICVLEGLLAYVQDRGRRPDVTLARQRAEHYLLERSLFRRQSTGEIIDEAWTRPVFPTTWHFDILRALDYLRQAGRRPDPRAAEAIERLKQLRGADGRWPQGQLHRDSVGQVPEGEAGAPSRWNTLRALRVLEWYGASE